MGAKRWCSRPPAAAGDAAGPGAGRAVDFSARALRTDGHGAGVRYPQVSRIRSPAELSDYIAQYGAAYALAGGAESFLDAALGWDDAFFKTHQLLLILLEERSGAIRHSVEAVTAHNGGLTVLIRRDVPDIGTADMAQWHIAVEVDAGLPEGPVDVVFA